jgi:hypothetical protein
VKPGPELTKIQRNELYKSIKEGGLDPALCEDLTQDRERRIPEIRRLPKERQIAQVKHSPSKSTFRIETGLLSIKELSNVQFFYRSTVAGEERSSGSGWQGVLQGARQWAEEVKREFIDPDLWEELRRGRELLAGARNQFSANHPFTPGEQAEIAEWIREIKKNVSRIYYLPEAQADHIDAILEEVQHAGSRVGRKDWLLLFLGALFSLFLSAAVPLEVVQHILATFADSLLHLFGSEPPRPLP